LKLSPKKYVAVAALGLALTVVTSACDGGAAPTPTPVATLEVKNEGAPAALPTSPLEGSGPDAVPTGPGDLAAPTAVVTAGAGITPGTVVTSTPVPTP